jgi:uncharacterized protein (UPF0276 family)
LNQLYLFLLFWVKIDITIEDVDVKSSLQLTGIGLRPLHHKELLEKRPSLAWLEIHSENFFTDGGEDIELLEQIRKHYPVSAHGIGLSIGSSDDLNWHYLKKLRDLINRLNPCLVSDHLSWSSLNGQYFHDLLPLPYTQETLLHVVERIKQVQDYLQRQILIENVSSYIQFEESNIPEWEFIAEVARQSECSILLDVNNVYVSATNLGFNPLEYLAAIPAKSVQEYHLGGFITTTIDHKEVLIDTHSRAVVPAVWELFREAVKMLGAKPTIIEWDNDIPSLDTLAMEAYRAEKIMRESYVTAKLTG